MALPSPTTCWSSIQRAAYGLVCCRLRSRSGRPNTARHCVPPNLVMGVACSAWLPGAQLSSPQVARPGASCTGSESSIATRNWPLSTSTTVPWNTSASRLPELGDMKVWPCTSIHWPAGSLKTCEPMRSSLSVMGDGMVAWAMSVARETTGARTSAQAASRVDTRASFRIWFKGNPCEERLTDEQPTLRHRTSGSAWRKASHAPNCAPAALGRRTRRDAGRHPRLYGKPRHNRTTHVRARSPLESRVPPRPLQGRPPHRHDPQNLRHHRPALRQCAVPHRAHDGVHPGRHLGAVPAHERRRGAFRGRRRRARRADHDRRREAGQDAAGLRGRGGGGPRQVPRGLPHRLRQLELHRFPGEPRAVQGDLPGAAARTS